MTVLVIAEHDNQTLKPGTANAITAAVAFGGGVEVLVAGQSCAAAASEAASLAGVDKVIAVDDASLTHQLAEDVAPIIIDIAKQYEAIIAAATTTGKNLLPRVAALLDVQAISDVLKIESKTQFQRPIYAGNVIATVESSDPIKVMTVRATAFDAAVQADASPIENSESKGSSGLSEFVSEELAESDRPELTAASIVVSGGRGVGSGENFKLIYDFADKLGAAVGASRAAVDAGYVPNDMQVGQTGKIVAPDLYVAVGISGAIQHLAGMKESKIIVAINKDEEAPIFQVADYGLVADLFEVLPELTQKV